MRPGPAATLAPMGPGDASDADAANDLDALIGDIRREAARRRAAPDFPLDEEARLQVEMDGQGPAGVGGGADLAAITAALRAVGARSAPPAVEAAEVADVAALTASAVTALSVRLSALERRAPGPRPRPRPGASDEPAADPLAQWQDVLLDHPTGRTLVAAGPEWCDRLREAGADAYGLDGQGERAGLLDHLMTVGDKALARTVVAGTIDRDDTGPLDTLAAELARTSDRVLICSEAPWAWRRRVGDARADTSATRPIGPEAWLEALTGAGLVATARYDAEGRTYLLTAGTSE